MTKKQGGMTVGGKIRVFVEEPVPLLFQPPDFPHAMYTCVAW